jgi:hypothetical protein
VSPHEASSNPGNPTVSRPGATHRRRPGGLPGAAARRSTGDPRSRWLQARGPRGELRFWLQVHQGGLYVEREEIPSQGLHCVQSMQFRDVRQFEQWCDRDAARFEHPLLHVALKRDAAALWQLGEQRDG